MKRWTGRLCIIALLLAIACPAIALAAAAKKYQVTGKVLSVDDKMIVVQKDDEKWEIERGAALKIDGDLKVGAKVTVYYHMVADSAEVKAADAKTDKGADKGADKKPAK